jgi:hypothetical protein
MSCGNRNFHLCFVVKSGVLQKLHSISISAIMVDVDDTWVMVGNALSAWMAEKFCMALVDLELPCSTKAV